MNPHTHPEPELRLWRQRAIVRRFRYQDDVFHAVSDSTRRRILAVLRSREARVSDLLPHFDLMQPAISKHLGALRSVDLVSVKRSGRERWYCLNARPLHEVRQWLEPFRLT